MEGTTCLGHIPLGNIDKHTKGFTINVLTMISKLIIKTKECKLEDQATSLLHEYVVEIYGFFQKTA